MHHSPTATTAARPAAALGVPPPNVSTNRNQVSRLLRPSRSKSGARLKDALYLANLPAYGGYRTESRLSIQPGVSVIGRRCTNVSKLALPRYAPTPLSPTPPKGRVGICKAASFRAAPPERVPARTGRWMFSISTKTDGATQRTYLFQFLPSFRKRRHPRSCLESCWQS